VEFDWEIIECFVAGGRLCRRRRSWRRRHGPDWRVQRWLYGRTVGVGRRTNWPAALAVEQDFADGLCFDDFHAERRLGSDGRVNCIQKTIACRVVVFLR